MDGKTKGRNGGELGRTDIAVWATTPSPTRTMTLGSNLLLEIRCPRCPMSCKRELGKLLSNLNLLNRASECPPLPTNPGHWGLEAGPTQSLLGDH